jgi:hypothetical protein
MHTLKSILVTRYCLSRAGVTLKENRLIYFTRENPNEDPDSDGNTPDPHNPIHRGMDDTGNDSRNILGNTLQGTESYSESVGRRQRTTDQRGGETQRGSDRETGQNERREQLTLGQRQREEDEERGRTEREVTQQTESNPSSPGFFRRLFKSPMDKERDSAVISTGATAAAVGGGVYAGMNAAKFAGIPVLGKLAAGIGTGLNYASAGVSSALTQVGAPAQMSALANPWLIGLGAPLVGLWALGKYRMRTLKSYYQNNPGSPNAAQMLQSITQVEDSHAIPRTFNTVKEGTKLVFGAMRWPIRAIPNALGSITGGGAAFVQNIGKKLGGLKGVLNWPIKNAGNIAKGGLAGGAAGLGTYAALSAAAGLSAPLIAPLLVGGGTAIWAYKKFKHGKQGANANLAMAG